MEAVGGGGGRLDIFTEYAIFTAVVKMTESVKLEGPFKAEALRVLRATPGLSVERRSSIPQGADAVIRFAGTHKLIAVQFKQRVNAGTAWQIVHYAETRPDLPLMLVAGQSTAESRAILKKHGIGLVDGLGNAHVELPGLLFHLESPSRPRRGKTVAPRLRGKAGVIAQALLLRPDRAWRIKDLTNEAAVSAGLAHRVLRRLEDDGIVKAEGTGPKTVRHVLNASALLDLWAEEERSRTLRTPGFVLAQTPRQLLEKVAKALEQAEIDHATTGAAAANLLAPFVTAIPVIELWVTALATFDALGQSIGFEQVSDGANVALLQQKDDTPLAFRERRSGVWLANRYRIYVDLLKDPRRGREQAQHLRNEVIGH